MGILETGSTFAYVDGDRTLTLLDKTPTATAFTPSSILSSTAMSSSSTGDASAKPRIPNPVAAVVGEVLGSHYYSHQRLNTLFAEHGAPGEPPDGNCVEKCERWLKRCNDSPTVDPLAVLGGVLERFMEVEPPSYGAYADEYHQRHERVTKVLERHGLRYDTGGRVLAPGTTAATRSLQDVLRARDLGAVDAEVTRALAAVDADPPAALTAACALVEAFCKVYLEDHGLPLPKEQNVKPLWASVQGHLGLDPAAVPASVAEADLKRILGGLASVVDGLGAFRTHAGSAHGRGRTPYRVAPRHARVAVNAAHALVLFAVETWDARRTAATSPVACRQVA